MGWGLIWSSQLALFIIIPLMVIWLFTIVDLFRRANLGGLGKSLWLLAILLLPVLGTVLYYVFRPLQVPRSRRPTERSSSALESRDTMLVDMHGRGVITGDEYEADRSPRGRSV